MKQLLELPLNLTIVSPAHTPNWDLVSDVVNSCSRIYRSSKQCRSRYESVLIPREEGKVSAYPGAICLQGHWRFGGARALLSWHGTRGVAATATLGAGWSSWCWRFV